MSNYVIISLQFNLKKFKRRINVCLFFVFSSEMKHIVIRGVHKMTWLSDAVFVEVFSRMELASLTLSGWNPNRAPKVSIYILLFLYLTHA